ncbi:LPXTG cell wall anchor domain-containing protein [Lutibacter sp. A64]|uniref:LPXTG cell wall anchor domain-containing protein n=1 Tax=Lutibacter sp. A64 TaxID=2918526 RepID=UPI001F066EE5|nr:LPXTG cell wall anchor domain-containing protein [Lutibacter sp. A64]UMB53876.1 LPXTG cell wall anchor domain-containing protein [Lutibacter sp. A64]
MNTRKIIGVLLIVLSLGLGYFGLNKVSDNSTSIEVLDLKVDLSNNSEKELGYVYVGLAVLVLGGGLFLLKKNSN